MKNSEAIQEILGPSVKIVEFTGCSETELNRETNLDKSLGSDHSKGWFAFRTCSHAFNLERNYPAHRGNVAFWQGVASGYLLALKLGN